MQGQDVTTAVDTYLAANFSNPSNPPLDRTLSSSSSAAPADVVGDLITDIYEGSTITVVTSVNQINPDTLEENKLLKNDGTLQSDTSADTTDYIKIETTKSSVAYTGLNQAGTARVCLPARKIMFFNDDKSVLSYVSDTSSNSVTAIPTNAKYVRVCYRSDYDVRNPMVEFVDNTTEISSVFVQYSEVETSTHGINDLQDLFNTVGRIETDVEKLESSNAVITYGVTWDWWISANSIDKYGNVYIGYIDTYGYAGVIRRQPDGTMQYKRLEQSHDDDDHNAMATIVLDDGKILVIGSHGHTYDNYIICWRSTEPYSIDSMEKLSFSIPQTGNYTYKTCYSQVYKYNGVLFDFMRMGSSNGGSYTYAFGCLISTDNGSTWQQYAVFNNGADSYNSLAHCTDDQKYLKVVCSEGPSDGNNSFKGCYIDLSTYKIYNLSDTEIGQMVAVNGGSVVNESCAKKSSMTTLTTQTTSTAKGRLFYTAKTPKANTVFIYAIADDAQDTNYTYKRYSDGTVLDIGKSGIPFGNTHYISGMCFGKDTDTVYYSKATTSVKDGNHELHKVRINSGSIESDTIITEASMCILRPLFLGNGELATVVGHYNDQTPISFTVWELKPLFTHA